MFGAGQVTGSVPCRPLNWGRGFGPKDNRLLWEKKTIPPGACKYSTTSHAMPLARHAPVLQDVALGVQLGDPELLVAGVQPLRLLGDRGPKKGILQMKKIGLDKNPGHTQF